MMMTDKPWDYMAQREKCKRDKTNKDGCCALKLAFVNGDDASCREPCPLLEEAAAALPLDGDGFAPAPAPKDVKRPYFAVTCPRCHWSGSSELCGSGDYWAQDGCECPRCSHECDDMPPIDAARHEAQTVAEGVGEYCPKPGTMVIATAELG